MDEKYNNAFIWATGCTQAEIRVLPRPPLEFQSNCLYDVWVRERHFILKEFHQPDELFEAAAREYNALKLLIDLDIAPKPVFYDPSLGPIVVYEYMEGEMWDRRRPTAQELIRLAEAWLRIHSVTKGCPWLSRGSNHSLEDIQASILSRFHTYAEWSDDHFSKGRQSAEFCIQLFRSRQDIFRELANYPPIYSFCRSDPRFANVINRPDGSLGLVDWENSGLRDPARELADILMDGWL